MKKVLGTISNNKKDHETMASVLELQNCTQTQNISYIFVHCCIFTGR